MNKNHNLQKDLQKRNLCVIKEDFQIKAGHVSCLSMASDLPLLLEQLNIIMYFDHLYINRGRWYLCHVPSTFATVNTHANVFFVFLPGGISKEWRHIVSANCHFEGETNPIVPMFTGLSGTPGRPQK